MVVNMVDVGEETGELDTMLYKVADNYDEEVAVLTESLTRLMEPLLIIILGGMVGFIVIALFMPLIALISNLSGGGGARASGEGILEFEMPEDWRIREPGRRRRPPDRAPASSMRLPTSEKGGQD